MGCQPLLPKNTQHHLVSTASQSGSTTALSGSNCRKRYPLLRACQLLFAVITSVCMKRIGGSRDIGEPAIMREHPCCEDTLGLPANRLT